VSVAEPDGREVLVLGGVVVLGTIMNRIGAGLIAAAVNAGRGSAYA
jgi:hypothetical protein